MTCFMSRQPRSTRGAAGSQGDVLGGHLGIGGAQEVLAVEVLLGFGLGGVDAEQAAGSNAQVAVQPGLGGDDAAELGPLVLGGVVGAVDELLELGDETGADGGVALGAFGVVADDEPLVIGDPHFLDAQVGGDSW